MQDACTRSVYLVRFGFGFVLGCLKKHFSILMNKKAVISLTIKMSYHIYILIPVLSPSTALM